MQAQPTESERTQPRIFYGWWIVVVGSVMRTVFGAFSYYGFSAFFNPLVEQFGWSRTALAGVLSLARLEGGIMALPAGYLFDRIGPRRMMFVGVLLTGSGYMLLSRTTSLLYFYVVFILMIQVGAGFGMGGVAVDVAIANWFRRKRGRAMGFATMGLSFGGILVTPLAFFFHRVWQAQRDGGGHHDHHAGPAPCVPRATSPGALRLPAGRRSPPACGPSCTNR